MKRQIAVPTAPKSTVSERTTLRRPEQGVVAWVRLMRVYQKIQHATTEEMRREGISVGQFDVLVQVGAAEGATQQAVADALLVTKSNVCQLLDRMERAGLVERRPHGRTNLLYLTTEGKQLHDRLVPAHERRIAEQLAALSPDEQATLSGLLRKLDHSLTS
ncbi:MAG: MarR family transcriptional regulator [Chloroflexi bacterium]|nr:MarR family transcriptional regulator [Chloroflexota bacterium]